MRRVEPIQLATLAICTAAGAALFFPRVPAMLLLGAPLGAIAGLAMALRHC